MQVLQVIDTLMYGGAQKLLVTFAQQAQKHGVKTTVLSLYESGGAPVRSQLEAYGAQVIVEKSRRLFDLKGIQRLMRVMRNGQFDIVHTHLTYANIIGGLVARLVGLPVVATLHSTINDARYAHPLRDRLAVWVMRYLDQCVLAIGYSVAEAHYPILRRELDIIPNAVLPSSFLTEQDRATLRIELTGNISYPICIAVGRFSPPKGYIDLLDAFARVHAKCPHAKLVIGGDGDLRPEIESKIAELELSNHVKLLGFRSDIPKLLATADIYVSASLWEGLPIAHLEAMAAGLPVVATIVGDVSRVVVKGTGFLVPPQKPDELAGAMISLLEDPDRRLTMGHAAQRHVLKHYNADEWFEKYLDLYSRAIA